MSSTSTTPPQPSSGDAGGPAPASRSARGVVVGYDGSPSAVGALAWATAEAARRGAPLTVLHAVDHHGTSARHGAELPSFAHQAQKLAEAVAHEGAGRVDRVTEHGRLDVRGVGLLAAPVQALVRASVDAELLVVGNRGRGRVVGGLLGSVAFSVTAAAACPVAVVRGGTSGPGAAGRLHPVVVGVDGSPAAELAVEEAARTAARCGALLRVVAAWTPAEAGAAGLGGAVLDEQILDAPRQAALAAAQVACQAAQAAHPQLSVEAVVSEEPPPVALADASRTAGLVVVGARGRTALSGLFLGSVSHATIHTAHCPVLVVRSPDQALDDRGQFYEL